MKIKERQVRVLVARDGKKPYQEWLQSVADSKARIAIDARVTRARYGNFGDYKIFHGIVEMRIDFGPGYRIYCGIHNDELIVLIGGGDKKTQDDDVVEAVRLWKEFTHEQDDSR